MVTDRKPYYLRPFEANIGIGCDHLQVFEAGVREGLRRANEAGNLDSKHLSAPESILIDLRFLVEEIENIVEAGEGSKKQIPRRLSQEGQPPFIPGDNEDRVSREIPGEVVA